MSSSDWSVPKAFRRAAALMLLLAVPLAGACTVKPLYSNPSSGGVQAGVTADLSSIAIKPVGQRYAQQVRNHLIFLFNRGAGQPAAAAYTLTLVVTALHQSGAVVQVGDDNEPTAGTVTMTANYSLTGTTSGEVVASGRRQISSAYDVPRQEFAAYRARLNAEDRAARELAELLNLAIAKQLSK
jgi:LPS-assembly lipoprotein